MSTKFRQRLQGKNSLDKFIWQRLFFFLEEDGRNAHQPQTKVAKQRAAFAEGGLRPVGETRAVCGLLTKRRRSAACWRNAGRALAKHGRSAACWPSMGGLRLAGETQAVCSLPAKHGRSAACRRSMDGLRPAGEATGVQEATRRGPPVTSHKPVSCGPFPDSLPQSLPFPQYNR